MKLKVEGLTNPQRSARNLLPWKKIKVWMDDSAFPADGQPWKRVRKLAQRGTDRNERQSAVVRHSSEHVFWIKVHACFFNNAIKSSIECHFFYDGFPWFCMYVMTAAIFEALTLNPL